ncbi:hypothetical protein BJ322DRAFT_1032299 [Thelephora terrestris]|uniref:Uncharacterized protein n=1 Tax=Thelephora terrestris TaxID=56493 RepID=A0A9P6HQT7_9AGAM|nr:hypothetical protein BJ322DRAFT_1032299 [Thelephora terrestris]
MRPHPPTCPTLRVHDLTPPLSPTTSVESSSFPVTPTHLHTPTFGNDCAESESVFEGRFGLLKNSSEVWEESKHADYDDPSSVTVADPGILISPSSSLLSGLDLLGGTTAPPLPEVTEAPTRSRSHQTSKPHDETPSDFPPPPTIVPNRRSSFGKSRPISTRPATVSPFSHPGLAASYECIPQQSHCPQPSTLQRRWSALPPVDFHPYSSRSRGSSEFVTAQDIGTVWSTRPTNHPDRHLNTPVVTPRVPTIPASRASPGFRDEPSPFRNSRRKDSEPFTSFIDMSTKSRVQKLFSKISGGFKPRSKRR